MPLPPPPGAVTASSPRPRCPTAKKPGGAVERVRRERVGVGGRARSATVVSRSRRAGRGAQRACSRRGSCMNVVQMRALTFDGRRLLLLGLLLACSSRSDPKDQPGAGAASGLGGDGGAGAAGARRDGGSPAAGLASGHGGDGGAGAPGLRCDGGTPPIPVGGATGCSQGAACVGEQRCSVDAFTCSYCDCRCGRYSCVAYTVGSPGCPAVMPTAGGNCNCFITELCSYAADGGTRSFVCDARRWRELELGGRTDGASVDSSPDANERF